MEKESDSVTNRYFIVVILLIVLVSSIAVVFWLVGGGITIVKSSALDPVVWTFQRPNQTVTIDEKLNVTRVEDGLLTIELVHIGSYVPILGRNGWCFVTLGLKMNGTATRPNMFINNVNIYFFLGKASMSSVDMLETEFDFKNLSLVEKVEGFKKNTSIKLNGVGHPSSVYTKTAALWNLYTPNEQDQQMEITYEAIYYNGTAFNKMVQPFQLNIQHAEE